MNNYLCFWDYFSKCFVPFGGLSLPLKPMHKEVCETLEKAVLGKLHYTDPVTAVVSNIEFVVVNIAPRVGKTKILEALATWQMAYFPDSHIINTSFSSTLAEASTRYVQLVMKTAWYKTLFPWVAFGDIERNNEFTTDKGGHVYGAGVGGTLTGFGAGLKRAAGGFIAIDDPANPNEALSGVMAESLQFWFENTILRRRNSSQYTSIIIVAQRLAVGDLSGYILENYPNQTLHLKFPIHVNDESLVPETITVQSILKTKAINPFVYWAQLQQEPIAIGGNMIKTADFFEFENSDLKWEQKILVCDTALKTKEANDWSVVACWGRLQGKAYLIDLARGKWESPELTAIYKSFYHKHHQAGSPVNRATVEDKAAGTGLGQILRREGIPIEPIERNIDKVTRVQDILPYTVTHMVGYKKNEPWVPGFLSECAQFRADGKAPHDDQVDTLCDGVTLLLGKSPTIWDVLGGKKK